MKKCTTTGCTDAAKVAGFCGPCYAFQNYWRKKSVGARVAHASRLTKAAKRKRASLLVETVPGRRTG